MVQTGGPYSHQRRDCMLCYQYSLTLSGHLLLRLHERDGTRGEEEEEEEKKRREKHWLVVDAEVVGGEGEPTLHFGNKLIITEAVQVDETSTGPSVNHYLVQHAVATIFREFCV